MLRPTFPPPFVVLVKRLNEAFQRRDRQFECPKPVELSVLVRLFVLGCVGCGGHFRFFTHVPALARGPVPFCGPFAVPPCPLPRPVPLPPPAPLLVPLALAMTSSLVCCY